jgi:hypothetical protein
MLAVVKGSNLQIWQQKGPVTTVNVTHKGEQQGKGRGGGGRFSLLNTLMLQNYRLYLSELLGFCPSSKFLNTRKHNISQTDPVSETMCFLVFRIKGDGQSPETQ